jgi:hypothetical protein
MNRQRLKKRYQEFRFGFQTVGPVIQLANFLMLSYLTISEVIPLWIFAPIFVIGCLITYTIIGNKFRNHQHATDLDLSYEKATQAGMTVYEMMDLMKRIADKTDTTVPESYVSRMQYMKDIGEGRK